jgi:hypothetical protein
MGYDNTGIASWVVVGVVVFTLFLLSVRLAFELWRLKRAGAYRVSTIVISRTSLEDLESAPPVPLVPSQLGEVCFHAGERHDLCFICCERAVFDRAGACGHGGMCGACFARLWAAPLAKCPICRALMRPA